MKSFSTVVVLRAEPLVLLRAMRDRLGEVAGALADVEAIEELERRPQGEDLLVVNRWHARQRIPGFLQARLGAGEVSWLDRALWSEPALACRWSIEPSIGEGAIQCSGVTRFEPAMGGSGSRAYFEGELRIDPAFIGSVAGPLQKPVTALVESIATTLIPSNFRAAAKAAAELGRAGPSA
jgi:hypothetical protein